MTTSTEIPAASGFSAPPQWRRWLAYLTVALMPASVNMERFVGPLKAPNYRSPFDYMFWLLFLLMAADLVLRKPWARFKLPPASTIIWSAVAVLSYLWLQGGTPGEWATAAANPVVVVMLATWVFSNLADDPGEFRRLALILCGSFGVCALWAFTQYIGPVGLPYSQSNPGALATGTTNMRLGGWYGNRMLFSAQAAMLVPAAAAFAVFDKDPVVKVLTAALAALALCVTMAVGGFVAAVAGAVAVAAACVAAKHYVGGLSLLAGLLLVIAVVLPQLPAKRANAAVLTRGLALFAKADEKTDDKITTPRLRRYQAALDFLSEHRDPMDEKTRPNWILGAGAGRYNSKVNDFYDPKYYPKPGAMTDQEARFDIEQHERDGFGLLEKTGVELGAAGLAALAFLFAAWLMCAAGGFMRDGTREQKVLALASLGACVGAAVVSVFAFPTQRAASGSTFAFFYGLAAWANLR